MGMANEYLVATHLGNFDEAHESKNEHDALPGLFDAMPGRFDELPDDLQHLVRKHTAASFVVEWHREEYVGWCCGTYFGDVPVIMRYEFKLQ